MLNIKLVRTGRKRDAHYRIVVSDSSRLGRVVETLGSYHPRGGGPTEVEGGAERRFDRERMDYWLGKGAQPSPTVRSFLRAVARTPAEAEPAGAEPEAAPAAPEPPPTDASG